MAQSVQSEGLQCGPTVCAKANGYARPLAPKVLRRHDLPFKARKEILQAIGVTVGEFNCAVWGPLSLADLRAWIQGHDALYRLVMHDDRHEHRPKFPTVYEVCGATGFPVPQAKLSALRILHASRVVEQDLEPLWNLLMAEDSVSGSSWLSELRNDLVWLRYWTPELKDVPFESFEGDALAVWLSEHQVKGPVRRALQAQNESLKAWSFWQWEQRQAGALRGSAQFRLPAAGAGGVCCPLCDFECSTGAQLAGHIAAAHHHRNPARPFMQGTHCRACLKQYWCPERLMAHLSSGSACLAFLVATVEPVTQLVEQIERPVDSEFDVLQAPVVRLQGPLRPVADDAIAQLTGYISQASAAERVVLCRAARAFNKGKCELTDCFLDVMAPPDLDKGPSVRPPMNPDGKVCT